MPDKKETDLLWMFKANATRALPKEIRVEPGDASYRLYQQTGNPFLRRAASGAATRLERSSDELKKLFHFIEHLGLYDLRAGNLADAQKRRQLDHPHLPPPPAPVFMAPERLRGHARSLPWMVSMFFTSVLDRLRANPGDFRLVVEELLAQFRADGLQIKLYDAYRSFTGWDDLMQTLEEISRYPGPDTFDLFCSALFAYYGLAFPGKQG